MNTQGGLQAVTHYTKAVDILVLAVDFTTGAHSRLTHTILDMLAALCVVSPFARTLVLDALDNYKTVRREKARFESMLLSLLHADDDEEYAVSCMSLVNAIINSAEDITARMHSNQLIE